MCFSGMGNFAPHTQAQPVVVELPRPCDAVGSALRDAYNKDSTLPDDMLVCLRKLDGAGELRPRY